MRNVMVLTASTLIYYLVYFADKGESGGGRNLLLLLFIFTVVLPFGFGYFTQKYLVGNSIWIPATTLFIPIIPNVSVLIRSQIKTGWGPMDVPLRATLLFIVLQAMFVVFGAYVHNKKKHSGD